MIGLLILAERTLSNGMMAAVEHTLGSRPPLFEVADFGYHDAPEKIDAMLRQRLQNADRGEGVLILADVYGATHTNVACRLLQRGRIELITGVNLPMLLRVLNYRHLKMDDLIDKALSGGCGGIICAANPAKTQEMR